MSTPQQTASRPVPRPSGPPLRTMVLDGEAFGWHEHANAGDGLSVLVHAGVFSAWFEPLAVRLPGRVLRMRRAGYLDGSPVLHPIDVSTHASHVAAVLDAERTADGPLPVVVAHSSGCAIALQLAIDRPDLVGRLVLSEPPLIPVLTGEDGPDAAAAEIGRAAMAAQAGDGATAFDLFLRTVCGPEYRGVLRDRLGDDGLAAAERESTSFFASEMPGLVRWAPPSFSCIEGPVVLVQGGESPAATHRMIARLAALVPQATVETVAGADHLLPLTHPDELARIVFG